MPIYVYKCEQGHTTELRQEKFEPKGFITCSACGEIARRIYSDFSFKMGKRKPIDWDSRRVDRETVEKRRKRRK